MTDFIQHLFDYQFLNRALITSIVVGIVCGTVGSLIILRGLSLMGDAMSHLCFTWCGIVILIQYSNVRRCISHWHDCKFINWLHFK